MLVNSPILYCLGDTCISEQMLITRDSFPAIQVIGDMLPRVSSQQFSQLTVLLHRHNVFCHANLSYGPLKGNGTCKVHSTGMKVKCDNANIQLCIRECVVRCLIKTCEAKTSEAVFD